MEVYQEAAQDLEVTASILKVHRETVRGRLVRARQLGVASDGPLGQKGNGNA